MIVVIVNFDALLLVIGLMVRRADRHTPNPSQEGNYGEALRQAQGDKEVGHAELVEALRYAAKSG